MTEQERNLILLAETKIKDRDSNVQTYLAENRTPINELGVTGTPLWRGRRRWSFKLYSFKLYSLVKR